MRDVRTAWLNANSAFQRLAVTEQLLAESTQAFDLAQSRYGLGLSSIVELSQAQLNKTSAQITSAEARYDYQIQRSVLMLRLGLAGSRAGQTDTSSSGASVPRNGETNPNST